MEFKPNQVLLITQRGKFFDQARIDWIGETGDARILCVTSTVRDEIDENKTYKIGEVRDETWEVFFLCSLEEAKLHHDAREALTLEIVR